MAFNAEEKIEIRNQLDKVTEQCFTIIRITVDKIFSPKKHCELENIDLN